MARNGAKAPAHHFVTPNSAAAPAKTSASAGAAVKFPCRPFGGVKKRAYQVVELQKNTENNRKDMKRGAKGAL